MKLMKVGIETVEEHGILHPKTVVWPDGRRFPVKKVLHYSTSDDGEFPGVRFTTIIGKEERYLYCVAREWFVMVQEGGTHENINEF